VTEAACNPQFARWLFAAPRDALRAVRENATQVLGTGLPGPEFEVPAIPLSDADCRAVIALQVRDVSQLASAVQAIERGGSAAAPRVYERRLALAAAS
jgi:hypothetical protein